MGRHCPVRTGGQRGTEPPQAESGNMVFGMQLPTPFIPLKTVLDSAKFSGPFNLDFA